MKTFLRLIATAILTFCLLLLTAYYADTHPHFADSIGGHNFLLPQAFVSFPTVYFLLGRLRPFRRVGSSERRPP